MHLSSVEFQEGVREQPVKGKLPLIPAWFKSIADKFIAVQLFF
jgi:hypothetical protein